MRSLVVAAMLVTIVSSSAYAQQPARGRTCSGLKARCEQGCSGRTGSNCETNCTSIFNICMQSGEWRGYKNSFSNVGRR